MKLRTKLAKTILTHAFVIDGKLMYNDIFNILLFSLLKIYCNFLIYCPQALWIVCCYNMKIEFYSWVLVRHWYGIFYYH